MVISDFLKIKAIVHGVAHLFRRFFLLALAVPAVALWRRQASLGVRRLDAAFTSPQQTIQKRRPREEGRCPPTACEPRCRGFDAAHMAGDSRPSQRTPKARKHAEELFETRIYCLNRSEL
jgi:hypothetical protein